MAASRKTADTLDTRERILEAAERLIAAGGVEAASTKAVTEAAGVRQGLFHYYFSSKEALLVELLKRQVAAYLEDSTTRLRQLAATSGLAGLFKDGVRSVETDPGAYRLRAELVQLGHSSPALRAQAAELLDGAREQLARNLAAVRGADQPNDRERAAAVVLKAAMDGLAQQKMLDPALDVRAAADALLEMTRSYLA